MGLTLIAPSKETNDGMTIQAVCWDKYLYLYAVLGYGTHFNARSRLYFGEQDDCNIKLRHIQTSHRTEDRQQFSDTEKKLTPVNFDYRGFGSLRRIASDDMTAHLVQRISSGRIVGYLWRPTASLVAGAEEVPPVNTLPGESGRLWNNAQLVLSEDLAILEVIFLAQD